MRPAYYNLILPDRAFLRVELVMIYMIQSASHF
jgi:hypothetical protein